MLVVVLVVVLGVLLLAVVGCAVGMAALLIPAVSSARGAAQKAQSRNNLRQIGIALHNYHDTYLTLPPAMLPDKDGKPSKSWRVMLLPFLEQSPLHDRYDSNNPWNAPSNAFVRGIRVRSFESPLANETTPGKTNYVVVVGPNTAFPSSKKMSLASIVDGTSITIFVLEIANSDIEWSEPRDLDFNTLVFAQTASPGAKNVVVAGAGVLMGDGSAVTLPRELSVEQLKAYLTASGAEPAPPLGF